MTNAKPKNVDLYIANSAGEARPILKQLRGILKSTLPGVEENISWGVPFYKYHGPFAGFATYKHHVSFGIAVGVLDKRQRESLEDKGYKTGLKTIQIKFDQKVPASAIRQILKLKMNERRQR